jgi:undecaprenyl-diphosphatase
MISDISALGSRELVLLFSIIMYFYLKLARGKSEALQFLFTIGLGISVILVTKSITSKHDDLNLTAILFETLSNFPSGHTFIATVLYFTIAQHLTSKKNSNTINKYLFLSASIFTFMVGISRFMGNGHTVTEVIAGWSLGLCWFAFAQMFLKINYKTFFNR